MRAHGYCLHCRRIKRINIRPTQAAQRIPYGECDDCLTKRQARQSADSGSSRPNHRTERKST